MHFKLSYITYLLFLPALIHGQHDRVDVFPDLEGEDLRIAVINAYKTSSVLSYGDARDVLYGDIDLVNDTLTCVYTGLQAYISPDDDPSSSAFAQNINTEHTYPRSKGADEFTLGYSDMHHLFPTRVAANSARGTLPFQEINDNLTDEWFYLNNSFSNIPNTNIDAYSEYRQNVAFEPREDHKGNVARAYFYFYTMYKSNADLADPNYFSQQQATLCDWHFADPVDQKEWERSKDIAAEQGNENPFILDCRLARLYCDNLTDACLTVSINDVEDNQTLSLVRNGDLLRIQGISTPFSIYLYSAVGQLLATSRSIQGDNIVDLSNLNGGLYIVTVHSGYGNIKSFKVVK